MTRAPRRAACALLALLASCASSATPRPAISREERDILSRQ